MPFHFHSRTQSSILGFLGYSSGTGFGPPCWWSSSFFCFLFLHYSYFLCAGLATHYYSWRFMQQFLGLVGFFIFFIVIFFFPETYHPGERGVDKLDTSLLPKWRPVILNPFQPLRLLRSPNLLAVVRLFLFFLSFQELNFLWESVGGWVYGSAQRLRYVTLIFAVFNNMSLIFPPVLLVPLAYTIVSPHSQTFH